MVDDDIEIFQVLRDSQPSRIGRTVERASRAALIGQRKLKTPSWRG
jgi:hypothetical protein